MVRSIVLGLTLALSIGTLSPSRAGELQFVTVECAQGIFGPVRESDVFHPVDVIDLRYHVKGLTLDPQGKCDLLLSLRITDADGAIIKTFERTIQQVMGFGGDEFYGHASYLAPEEIDPGEYTFRITLHDRIADKTIAQEKKLTCKERGFRISILRTFRDPERRVPGGTRWTVNERLHFALVVVGEDRSRGRVNLKLQIQVTDDEGNNLIPEPIKSEMTENRPEVLEKASSITMAGAIGLHSPGKFRLKITIQDVLTGQTATEVYPIQVDLP